MGKFLIEKGELTIGRAKDVLFCEDLGACLCIAVLDLENWICGMGCIILPEPPHSYTGEKPARYGQTALKAITQGIIEAGGSISNTATFLAGGSRVLPNRHCTINRPELGERNIKATMRALQEQNLRLIASDAGGQGSRALSVNLESGEVVIRDNQDHNKLLYQLEFPSIKAA